MGGLGIFDLIIVIVSVIGILVVLFHFKKGKINKKELVGGILAFVLLIFVSMILG